MLSFKRICGHGFQSYEQLTLDITPGKHLITGNNGSGKSSIPNLITWTMYGQSERGKDPSKDGKGYCDGSIEFSKGTDDYRIVRNIKKKKNSVEFYCNGVDVSPRVGSNIEDSIQATVDIPYDVFIAAIVVMQGLPVNFSTMTPTVRKMIIETIMGLDNWGSIKAIFDNVRNTSMEELNILGQKQSSLDNSLTALTTELDTTMNIVSDHSEDLTVEIRQVKKSIQKLSKDINAKESLRDGITTDSIQDVRKQYQEVCSQYASVQSKIDDLITIIEDRVCPTCHQSYPESMISDAVSTRDILSEKLERIDSQKQNFVSIIESLESIGQDLRGMRRDHDNLRYNLTQLLEKLEEREVDNAEVISEIRMKIEDLIEKKSLLDSSIEDVSNNVENIRYIIELLQPSSPFRTAVLSRYLGYINNIIEEISPFVLTDMTVGLMTDKRGQGISIEVNTSNNRTYISLSGGEKRRIDIVLILALQRFLIECSGIRTNLLIFDEIFDSLDDDGITTILNCINSVFQEDMAIYVMSHKTSFKQMFSSIIRVSIENGSSIIH